MCVVAAERYDPEADDDDGTKVSLSKVKGHTCTHCCSLYSTGGLTLWQPWWKIVMGSQIQITILFESWLNHVRWFDLSIEDLIWNTTISFGFDLNILEISAVNRCNLRFLCASGRSVQWDVTLKFDPERCLVNCEYWWLTHTDVLLLLLLIMIMIVCSVVPLSVFHLIRVWQLLMLWMSFHLTLMFCLLYIRESFRESRQVRCT